MDARVGRIVAGLAVLLLAAGATYQTPNFVIHCDDPELARELGEAAERYRKELAQLWLGRTLPDWSRPCPVKVRVGPTLGAGGATTFVFDRGEVYGWQMTIQGSRERLLDSVLPHEITHMILASHFRQPLPRWADEGAATVVEHISEREKHRRMLLEFLRTRRGIPFRHMFAMEEYPADIMPLYAQGYTLAEYLIQLGGHQQFVKFLEEGLKTNNWDAALARWYNIPDLGQLQLNWVAWVERGFPQLRPIGAEIQPNTLLAGGTSDSAWRAKTPPISEGPSVYQRLAASAPALASQSAPGAFGTFERASSSVDAATSPSAPIAGGAPTSALAQMADPPLVDVTGWRPARAAGTAVLPDVAEVPLVGIQKDSPTRVSQAGYPQSPEAPSRVLLEWSQGPAPIWR